ncbi:SAM domain (Sterile alpha motif) domain containing protein [Balamuthia mandrillaris]
MRNESSTWAALEACPAANGIDTRSGSLYLHPTDAMLLQCTTTSLPQPQLEPQPQQLLMAGRTFARRLDGNIPEQQANYNSGGSLAAADPGSSISPPSHSSSQEPSVGSSQENKRACDLCDKWLEERSLGRPASYDLHSVLPLKCGECSKKGYGGVSYVVESECQQGETVRGKSLQYRSLPHPVYRPCNLKASPSQYLTDRFAQVIKDGPAVLTSMSGEVHTVNEVRTYLLRRAARKHLYETIQVVTGLAEIRSQINDKREIFLHYKYHPELVIVPCFSPHTPSPCSPMVAGSVMEDTDAYLRQCIEESDIQIALLIRKGTNKPYGYTWNCRLELYVTSKRLWESLTPQRRNELKYLQECIESTMLMYFKRWNRSIDCSPSAPECSKHQQPQQEASPLGKSKKQYRLCMVGMSDIFRIELIPVTTTVFATTSLPIEEALLDAEAKLKEIIVDNDDAPVTAQEMRPKSSLLREQTRVRKYTKTEWHFPVDNIPKNFNKKLHHANHTGHASTSNEHAVPLGPPVGVTTYNDFFSEEELNAIEVRAPHYPHPKFYFFVVCFFCFSNIWQMEADVTDSDAKDGKYASMPNTHQSTHKGKANRLCRTKFFFAARYLWTKEQMEQPDSHVSEGIRADVAAPPTWMKNLVEKPLAEAALIPENWVNEYAMNIYHDGTEGLGQHYDDKKRFQRPIYSLRLFSSSRLAFGSKDFSMTNSLFFIPMPRGCITVLEKDSYAADGVKHCIRPVDMGGKCGVVILRQIHTDLFKEAKERELRQWFIRWFKYLVDTEGLWSCMRSPEEIQSTTNSVIEAFLREEITEHSLANLNECDLKMLGFTKMGPRKIVLAAIHKLKEQLTGVPLPVHMPCNCTCSDSLDQRRQVAIIAPVEVDRRRQQSRGDSILSHQLLQDTEEVLESGNASQPPSFDSSPSPSSSSSSSSSASTSLQQATLFSPTTPPGNKRRDLRKSARRRSGASEKSATKIVYSFPSPFSSTTGFPLPTSSSGVTVPSSSCSKEHEAKLLTPPIKQATPKELDSAHQYSSTSFSSTVPSSITNLMLPAFSAFPSRSSSSSTSNIPLKENDLRSLPSLSGTPSVYSTYRNSGGSGSSSVPSPLAKSLPSTQRTPLATLQYANSATSAPTHHPQTPSTSTSIASHQPPTLPPPTSSHPLHRGSIGHSHPQQHHPSSYAHPSPTTTFGPVHAVPSEGLTSWSSSFSTIPYASTSPQGSLFPLPHPSRSSFASSPLPFPPMSLPPSPALYSSFQPPSSHAYPSTPASLTITGHHPNEQRKRQKL